jgi:predicted NAD-dependent protein-ADP-ribosyltransferase YbiA (DUF1768 family)
VPDFRVPEPSGSENRRFCVFGEFVPPIDFSVRLGSRTKNLKSGTTHMKVRLKSNLIVVTAESLEERESLAVWSSTAEGHVFALVLQPDGQTFRLNDLGLREVACREPLNVTSRATDEAVRLISNFASTPFELDDATYGSVEAFWQGLKFPEESRRREIAPLSGDTARRAGFGAPESAIIEYLGKSIRVGTSEHWRLMAIACWAKFGQHKAARHALLSTGERPLVHKTRKDSRTIPGVVMADIWMKVRRGLIQRAGLEAVDTDEADDESEPETESAVP